MAQNGKQKVQRVQFVETVLRDANQSLIATRLPYSKFEAILPTMDKAGYYACECWGGATFDVCLRYLHEVLGAAAENPGQNTQYQAANGCSGRKRPGLLPLSR